MLLLLKPWRNLHDLKDVAETFEDAYEHFISQADDKIHRVVTNIQYYHKCFDGAKAEREKARTNPELVNAGSDRHELTIDIDDAIEVDEINTTMVSEPEITDDDIERAQVMRTNARERLHGESAVWLGYDVGFFKDTEPGARYTNAARIMEPDKGEKISAWERQLKATTCEQINWFGTLNLTEEIGMTIEHSDLVEPSEMTNNIRSMEPEILQQREDQTAHVGRQCDERVELAQLNEEQRRAHDIIEEKLKEHLTSELKKRRNLKFMLT